MKSVRIVMIAIVASVLRASVVVAASVVVYSGVFEDGDLQTWGYAVTADGDHDVSHFVVGIGQCYEVVACEPSDCEIGVDPTTGLYGVKWDIEIPVGEMVEISFTTNSPNPRLGEVEWSIKEGQDIVKGLTTGPVCPPNEVTLLGMSVDPDFPSLLVSISIAIGIAGMIIIFAEWRRRRRS